MYICEVLCTLKRAAVLPLSNTEPQQKRTQRKKSIKSQRRIKEKPHGFLFGILLGGQADYFIRNQKKKYFSFFTYTATPLN